MMGLGSILFIMDMEKTLFVILMYVVRIRKATKFGNTRGY